MQFDLKAATIPEPTNRWDVCELRPSGKIMLLTVDIDAQLLKLWRALMRRAGFRGLPLLPAMLPILRSRFPVKNTPRW